MYLILLLEIHLLREYLIAVVAKTIDFLFGMVDKGVKYRFERLIVFGAINVHLIAVARIVIFSEFFYDFLTNLMAFVNEFLLLLRIGLLHSYYQ